MGKALAFYASQRIAMRKVKLEKTDGITDDEGIKVSCRVAKNRISKGNPYKAAKYTAIFGHGIDVVRGVALTAIENEIVQGSNWIYYPDKDNCATLPDGELAKWNGMGKFVDYLRDNPDFMNKIKSDIENKAKQGSIKTEQLSEEEVNAIGNIEKELSEDSDLILEDV